MPSKRLNIMLYCTTSRDCLILPVNPENIDIKYEKGTETYNILGFGEVDVMGFQKVMDITLKNFLPEDNSPFAKNSSIIQQNLNQNAQRDYVYSSSKAVEILKNWAKNKVEIRLVIDIELNIPCYIVSFTQTIKESSLAKPFILHIRELRNPISLTNKATGLFSRLSSLVVPKEIILKSTETLYSVAAKYGLDFKILAKINEIKNVNANLEGKKLLTTGAKQ